MFHINKVISFIIYLINIYVFYFNILHWRRGEKKLKEKLAEYQAEMLEKQKLLDEKRKEHDQMRVMYNKLEQEMNTYKHSAPNVPANQNIVVHTAIGHMPEFDVKDDRRIYQARLKLSVMMHIKFYRIFVIQPNLKIKLLKNYVQFLKVNFLRKYLLLKNF